VPRLWLLLLLAFTHASSSAAADGPALFSSYDLIELKLEAPLRELITKARENENYAVTGKLTVVDRSAERNPDAIDVKISTRGHTSKQTNEC